MKREVGIDVLFIQTVIELILIYTMRVLMLLDTNFIENELFRPEPQTQTPSTNVNPSSMEQRSSSLNPIERAAERHRHAAGKVLEK